MAIKVNVQVSSRAPFLVEVLPRPGFTALFSVHGAEKTLDSLWIDDLIEQLQEAKKAAAVFDDSKKGKR